MAIVVRDLLKIDIMKNFKLLAGAKGLDRVINETEILDFEFDEGNLLDREKQFNGESIVLTSLLFAKDKPWKVVESIKKLNDLNVSAIGFKPVIYKEFPKEALELADKLNLPVFQFGGDEFFEHVIFQVKEKIAKENNISRGERLLDQIIHNSRSEEEELELKSLINYEGLGYTQVAFINYPKEDKERIEDIIEAGLKILSKRIAFKTSISKVKKHYAIVLTQEECDEHRFSALLDDLMISLGLPKENCKIGFSSIEKDEMSLGKMIREAYAAVVVAEVNDESRVDYNNIGLYKLLVPYMNNKETILYMKDYLKPTLDDEELLNTAIEYIKNNGDVQETSERLFCHKNTIRYRIGKLQERLDPNLSEKAFYESLSVAIKIYKLNNLF